MNAAPPDVTSLRPHNSGMSQISHNAVTNPNFNMNPSMRPLGPPNLTSQNSSNIGPYSSQTPHSHGVTTQGPPFGSLGPPNNAPPNYSVANGQGYRPSGPNVGLGNVY